MHPIDQDYLNRKRQTHEEVVAIMFGNLDLWEQIEQASGDHFDPDRPAVEMSFMVDVESNDTATKDDGRRPNNDDRSDEDEDDDELLLHTADETSRSLLTPALSNAVASPKSSPAAGTITPSVSSMRHASLPAEFEALFERHQRQMDEEIQRRVTEIQTSHMAALRAELATLLNRHHRHANTNASSAST